MSSHRDAHAQPSRPDLPPDKQSDSLILLDGSTGQESDGHEWINLLTRWGLLEHDMAIARWMRAFAWLVCVASIGVAFWSELQAPREQAGEGNGLPPEAHTRK